MTRHQKAATGFNPATGEHVQIPLKRGVFKTRLNNARKHDGSVHRFCPPERVEAEIDRMLAIHRSHREMNLAPEVESAWLHHAFLAIHPFQDGNGWTGRLLAALPFSRAGTFPPTGAWRCSRDGCSTASPAIAIPMAGSPATAFAARTFRW